MPFTEAELEYLGSQRLGRLATVRKDGSPQNSPVGFKFNAALGTIDIAGRDMANSQKFKNVRDGGKVAFVVDDVFSVQPWVVRCLEIRGDAEAVLEPEEGAGHLPGPIIRIRPRQVIGFGFEGEGGNQAY